MKLTFSPASPFARKVRIAAIELGLIDKIELVPASVAPGTANEEYQRISPLKKLPVLILTNGDVITTGTPPGVGLGMKPPQFLKIGDVVTLGIDGLGEQRQEIVAA